jgi:hypothetical protein
VLISIVAIVCQIWFFGQGLLVADVFSRHSAATIAGLLGAVGASGGTGAQDEAICAAGVNAAGLVAA